MHICVGSITRIRTASDPSTEAVEEKENVLDQSLLLLQVESISLRVFVAFPSYSLSLLHFALEVISLASILKLFRCTSHRVMIRLDDESRLSDDSC
jgi:hypothetical protein